MVVVFLSSITVGLLALCSGVAGSPARARIVERAEDIKDSYDYVIAGGGTAGLTVADRLTASGKYTVLVIEHGILDNSTSILAGMGSSPGTLYPITSVPQRWLANRTQAVNVGNVVGGSSAINGMAFMRGTADEYDGWAELGGGSDKSTWDWKGVLPFFRRAAYFTPPRPELAKAFNMNFDIDLAWGQDNDTMIYASSAPNQDPALLNMWNLLARLPGIDIPKDGCGGTNGLFWITASRHPTTYERSYARTGHYDGAPSQRSNYDLLPGHKVNAILFNGTTATGLRFTPRADLFSVNGTAPGPRTVSASKEVILAAGAIHTPQILQLSGIGDARLLARAGISPVVVDLPGVGQRFQDQGYVGGMAWAWGNTSAIPRPPKELIDSVPRVPGPVGFNYNAVARLGMPVVAPDSFEKIAADYENQDPAAYLPEDTHPDVIKGYAAWQKLHAKLLRKKNASFFGFTITAGPGGSYNLQHSLSHGTVTLNTSDPTAEPIVDYRALSNPTDVAILVAGMRFVRSFMTTNLPEDFAAAKPYELSPGANVTTDEEIEAWLRRTGYIPTLYHPIGTAAKMPRELGGVVDETLLVHGVQKLSVVDASIMPTMPGAPTSQTVYMIAEKAAELIKARA